MSKNRLIDTGNAVVDLVMPISAIPARGSDVFASGAKPMAGGGFNVAAAAARHGMAVLYAGQHGTGPFGDLIRAAMLAEGVELLHRPQTGCDSGVSVVVLEPAGERTFISAKGAEAIWPDDALAAVDLRPGDTVYLTGYSFLHPTNAGILAGWTPDLADQIRVVIDLCPVIDTVPPKPLAAVLNRADWICGNQSEAAWLTGADDPAKAARQLAYRARRGAIVRVGADGCWLSSRVTRDQADQAQLVPGFAVSAIDMTGAGDTHVAVFTAALASGMVPIAAARRANAAAALAVTELGPATSPSRVRLDAFLAASERTDRS